MGKGDSSLGTEAKLRDRPKKPIRLSARQREVLTLVAQGATDNEIACRLCLSSPSVPEYVKRIRKRLGANSRAHAVALALRLGLIDADPPEQLST